MSTIKISVAELTQLKKDAEKLAALEAGGVDNWEYYDDAMSSLLEKEVLMEKRCALLDDLEVIFGECAYEPSDRGAGVVFTEDVRHRALLIMEQMGVIFDKG